MPIVVTHVVDDQSALFLAEVDVKVGHRHPFRVEEAFEQQRVAQGIQIGDAERKGDQRPGPGAAPRPDRHIVVLGPVDEIGNDQEVAGETHLYDGFRLRAQARLIGRAGAFAFGLVREKQHQTFFQPGHRLLAQEIIERHARWCREIRQIILAQGDRQIAAPGDLHGIFQRLGQIGEQLAHFRLRLEILLLGIGARAALVAEHIAFGDAHARLVREEIVAVEELDRMRGHQRQIERGRQFRRRRNQCFLLHLSAWMHALDFKIEGVGKAFRPIPGARRRLFAIPLRERLADIAQPGAGEGDQPVDTDLIEHLTGDFRPPAHARRKLRPREQFAELQVALMRTAQQQQAPGAIGIVRIGHEHIAAEDRLQAPRTRRRIELDHPEEIGKVSQRQRRHPVGKGAGNRRTIVILADIQTNRAIGDGVFAVQAQVDKAGIRHGPYSTLSPVPGRDEKRLHYELMRICGGR